MGGGGSDCTYIVRGGCFAFLRRSSRNPMRRKAMGTTTISAATMNTSGDRLVLRGRYNRNGRRLVRRIDHDEARGHERTPIPWAVARVNPHAGIALRQR